MPDKIPSDSVGLVDPQTHHFDQPLNLVSGAVIQEYDLAYETYGKLNKARSNAILRSEEHTSELQSH